MKSLFLFTILFTILICISNCQPPTLIQSIVDYGKNWTLTTFNIETGNVVGQVALPFPAMSMIGILDYSSTNNTFTLMYLNDRQLTNTLGYLIKNQTSGQYQLKRQAQIPLEANSFINTLPLGYDPSYDTVITTVANLENNTVTLMKWDFKNKQQDEIPFDFVFTNNTVTTGVYNAKGDYYYCHFTDANNNDQHTLLVYAVNWGQNSSSYVFPNWDQDINQPVYLLHTLDYVEGQLYGLAQNGKDLILYSIKLFKQEVDAVITLPNPYPINGIPYAVSNNDYIVLITSSVQNQYTYTVVDLSTLDQKSYTSNNLIPGDSWFLFASN